MKTFKIILSAAVAAGSLLLGACSDGIEFAYPENSDISVSNATVTEVGGTYANVEAHFYLRNLARYTGAGFCVSLPYTEDEAVPELPTIYDDNFKATISGDTIKATLSGLATNRLYLVRAYVCEYQGPVSYSDPFVVATAEGSLDEQLATYKGPKYADYYVDFSGWGQRFQWNLANVHDPSVVRAADGYYYMYQTDASYGNAHTAGGHFHGRRSKDLVNWEYLGGTMAELPAWVVEKLNELRHGMGLGDYQQPDDSDFGYWAPSVVKVNDNLYRMYYSIVVPGLINGDMSWGERAFIGMMETSDPADNQSWEDKGYVITNCSDKNLDFNIPSFDYANCYYKFNAIDPSVIINDKGEHWMIYGSWHCGIAAIQLDAATGKPAAQLGNPWGADADIAAYGKLIATRQSGNRWQASEGPEIIYRNGYYYLFLAYDALDVPYNTRVVRSTSITGPYVGIDGADVTAGAEAYPIVTHPYKFEGSDGWVGISHCTVFSDGNDNWYYASQARMPAGVNGNEYSNALMMGHVRAIDWTEDGWPVVRPERYGAVPQVPVTEEEIAGTWDHIDLGYAYGRQKTSSPMVFAADHTIASGTWEGAQWSYDAENQILTANGVKLIVRRECDWESADRHHTIVYAGYNNQKTYWGKKQ